MIEFPKRSGIYGFICPITNEMRYVGQSADMRKRVNGEVGHSHGLHRGTTKIAKHFPFYLWLVSLLRKGLLPSVVVIEFCHEDELDDKEIGWIKLFRDLGCRLLNCSEGGNGVRGFRWTDEMKRRQSERFKGRRLSEESRRKCSVSQKILWSSTEPPPQLKGLRRAQDARRTQLNSEQERLLRTIFSEFRSASVSVIQQVLCDEGLSLSVKVIVRMRKTYV